MTPDSYYDRLIRGRQRGLLAAGLRCGLAAFSWPYRLVVGLRNAYYDHVRRATRRADVPVISVGNLVTGGTGKTPMVIWILQRLVETRRRPGVLMRGYKASQIACCQANQALQDAIHGCENDEAREIRRRCPRADLVIDPDRVAGAAKAAGIGCDVLVMDDGFQHRRLARDLDVVLVDATFPFGGGLLPRGMRREPIDSLKRADVVVITRADQVHESERDGLRRRLGELTEGAPVLCACHRPVELCDQTGRCDAGTGVDSMRGRRAWIFAALGNPAAFSATVERMGCAVVGSRFWPDHHAWSDAELDDMARAAGSAAADVILTTEKDAVKLPPDRPKWPAPLRVVRIGMDFLGGDADVMCAKLSEVVAGEVRRGGAVDGERAGGGVASTHGKDPT
ncbi:MAG: tetraacyldisaccharide 4'-kinase [Phycisphaerae bacterium]|nr:tetraacyldisaccharide 4'-kinase [Phycisphaerae bacterium]